MLGSRMRSKVAWDVGAGEGHAVVPHDALAELHGELEVVRAELERLGQVWHDDRSLLRIERLVEGQQRLVDGLHGDHAHHGRAHVRVLRVEDGPVPEAEAPDHVAVDRLALHVDNSVALGGHHGLGLGRGFRGGRRGRRLCGRRRCRGCGRRRGCGRGGARGGRRGRRLGCRLRRRGGRRGLSSARGGLLLVVAATGDGKHKEGG